MKLKTRLPWLRYITGLTRNCLLPGRHGCVIRRFHDCNWGKTRWHPLLLMGQGLRTTPRLFALRAIVDSTNINTSIKCIFDVDAAAANTTTTIPISHKSLTISS
mmetsp:Transcript_50704/g.100342  ORF Transcript_50704/g.100342 Transcript_50704/m.100342 type:complete len:104 (+) Transcript_50704:209-520(+)